MRDLQQSEVDITVVIVCHAFVWLNACNNASQYERM
jgi:hypothetical protein